MYWKMQFLYKIFWQSKMLCRPTIPSFFSELQPETHTHIYIYFFFFFFGLMKGHVCIISNEVWFHWRSFQRSRYSMEYHGNHYFFNIKIECFCTWKVWYLLSYWTLHMLHKILSVSGKVHRFPILSKWVGYFDPYLIRSKIWSFMIENSYGVKIGNIGLYIFIFIFISEIDC